MQFTVYLVNTEVLKKLFRISWFCSIYIAEYVLKFLIGFPPYWKNWSNFSLKVQIFSYKHIQYTILKVPETPIVVRPKNRLHMLKFFSVLIKCLMYTSVRHSTRIITDEHDYHFIKDTVTLTVDAFLFSRTIDVAVGVNL